MKEKLKALALKVKVIVGQALLWASVALAWLGAKLVG